MRLINTTSIEVEVFTGTAPPYAILSHRWEEEEVALEDMKPGGNAKAMKGYNKLRISCAIASRDGHRYIWIDTCCIDKTSSAELSEAINSMFRYYREAVVCYAYLSDVSSIETPGQINLDVSKFCQSAWFTRGWTLQELIAPNHLVFYNQQWDFIGTKADLKHDISYWTKIPEEILLGGDLSDESISRKMSWASSRQTTVSEDIAYCLLGLFDVNIPLLYGEGEEKAFLRLQEAILKSSDDNSIFLWRSSEREAIVAPFAGLLAKSPTYFSMSPDIGAPCTTMTATNTAASLTGRGVDVELLLALVPNDPSESIYAALIYVDDGQRAYGPLLRKLSHSGRQFARVGTDILLQVDKSMRMNYSQLPHRIMNSIDTGFGLSVQQLDIYASDRAYYEAHNELKEPQPWRFYVRQNPKTSSTISREAIGFCFDSEQSIPSELSVDDWSSKWNRWEGGRFINSAPTYLLDFEMDQQWQVPNPYLIPTGGFWTSELFGVLQLSEVLSKSTRRLALCSGLQQTSANFMGTAIPCIRPWCHIFDLGDTTENPDQTLKRMIAQDSPLQKLNPSEFSMYSGYYVSFELQTRYGQVYYLIKVRRKRGTPKWKGEDDAKGELGSRHRERHMY